MTATPLDLIAARAERASAGPWEARAGDSGKGKKVVGPRKPSDLARGPVVLMQPLFWDSRSARNAEFIAAAREDVPRLIQALRAVEALCVTSEEHAAEYGDTASVYVDDIRAAIREALEA